MAQQVKTVPSKSEDHPPSPTYRELTLVTWALKFYFHRQCKERKNLGKVMNVCNSSTCEGWPGGWTFKVKAEGTW